MRTLRWMASPAWRFFFSSRRRHTRLQGDWSSDVCSSDLAQPHGEHIDPTPEHAPPGENAARGADREVGEHRNREGGPGGRVPAEHEERSEEHTSELQSPCNLVCRLLLEKKKK